MPEPFIKRIKVQNFKSFADLDLDLKRFNVIIGANASGKSNFVQIFRFLRDTRRYGLDNAVSMQGGPLYISNQRLAGKSTVIEVETQLSEGKRIPVQIEPKLYAVGGKWHLEFKATGQKIELIEDSCTFRVSDRATLEPDASVGYIDTQTRSRRREWLVDVTRGDGTLHFTGLAELERALGDYAIESPAPNQLLFESRILEHFFPTVFCFERIGAYDFGMAVGRDPYNGIPVLKDDGSNLTAVMRKVLSDDADRETLNVLVSDLIPSVKSIEMTAATKPATFASVEEHLEETPLPFPLLSGGTVAATALIASLYFEAMQVVIIEEPERHMHPYLLAKVVEMMVEASQERQVITITHNPELLRHVGLDSLYAIKRGSSGFSEISRPSTNTEIMGFLEHGLGISEMHAQRMLEW